MCSLQRNYDVIRNWERFETGPLTVLLNLPSIQYIQVHFRLDIFLETHTMNPCQTAPSLIWVHIFCNIGYIRT